MDDVMIMIGIIIIIIIIIIEDQIKEDEMGGARRTHVRNEICVQNYGWRA
jgi:hypothetical protein